MYYVYLLESQKDKSWYIGSTSDLRKRFDSHNEGNNISTKGKILWELIYYEAYVDEIDSKKREKFFKSGSGRKFLKIQLANYFNNPNY